MENSNLKKLKFKPSLVQLVLDGSKTVIWRLFDDKNLSVGDGVEMLNSETKEKFAEAKIVAVREKRLGDVVEVDYEEGHERYASSEEMIDRFRSYYGDRVNEDSVLKIIKFEIIKEWQM